MKVRTVTSVQEIKLDHSKTCEYCGKTYIVIQRAYGHGKNDDFGFGRSHLEGIQQGAEQVSSRNLLRNKTRLLPYHRCTECGQYGPESIDQMKNEGYRRYLKDSREFRRSSLILFLAFLMGLGYCIIQKENTGYLIIMIAFSTIFGLGLIIGWPISKKTWNDKVENINSPEIVSKWLAKWNEEHAKESRKRTQDSDLLRRESAWKYIKGILGWTP